jgi:broad specificity phosphatase PhoE
MTTNSSVLCIPKINTWDCDLTLIRHAQGVQNAMGVFNTLAPFKHPLTELGIKQAQEVNFSATQNMCFFSSNFTRCSQTASYLSDNVILDDRFGEPKFYTQEDKHFNINFVLEYDRMCAENPFSQQASFGHVESFESLLLRYCSALQSAFDFAKANKFNHVVVIAHFHTLRILLNVMENKLPFEPRNVEMCIPYQVAKNDNLNQYWLLAPEKETMCFRIPLVQESDGVDIVKQIINETPSATSSQRKIDSQILFIDGKRELFAILTKRYRFRSVNRVTFSQFAETAKRLFPETYTTLPFQKQHYFTTLGSNVGYTGKPVENESVYPDNVEKTGAIRAVWKNNDGSFCYYPDIELEPEATYNGFVSANNVGELISVAIKNQQDTFTLVDSFGTSFTICVTEKRAYNLSQ